jgi:hypothetical protein
MVFTVLWRRQSKAAAILSPILGLATGLTVWLTTAGHFGGEVTVATTGQVLPCVYGTVASAFSPILYSVLITLIRPQDYDWNDLKKEKLSLERLESDLTTVHHETRDSTAGSIEDAGVNSAAVKAQELKRWGRIAAFWAVATFLGHWVLWPLPMYGSHYVFGKGFYIAWVVVAIIWLWATTFVATLYPIFDGGYQQILQVYRGLRGRHPSTVAPKSEGESAEGSISDSAQGEQVKA